MDEAILDLDVFRRADVPGALAGDRDGSGVVVQATTIDGDVVRAKMDRQRHSVGSGGVLSADGGTKAVELAAADRNRAGRIDLFNVDPVLPGVAPLLLKLPVGERSIGVAVNDAAILEAFAFIMISTITAEHIFVIYPGLGKAAIDLALPRIIVTPKTS